MTDGLFKLLRTIVILNIKYPIHRAELARLINRNQRQPLFREMIDVLIKNNICEEIDSYFKNSTLLKINLTKLEDFIRENSDEFKMWGKFIEVTTPAYNY